jgi:murein hydrolase activator
MPLFHPRIRLLTISLSAMILLFSGGGQANETTATLEKKLVEQQQRLHRQNRGIEAQKSRIIDSRQKETGLLAELEHLENRLQQERQQLSTLQEQMDIREEQLIARKARLDELLQEQEVLAQQVKKRLFAYYRMGEKGRLHFLFSATSIHELRDLEEIFRRLLRHDQQVIAEYRMKINEVSNAHQELELEREQLVSLIEDHLRQEQRTYAARQQQMELIQSVQAELKVYQMVVQEMEKDALLLTAAFDKLREEGPALQSRLEKKKKAEPGDGSQDFAAQKGRLLPPVAGEIVIGFGQEISGRFGITTRAHGIGIKTEAGAPIKAVYNGKVVFSGFLRGYGNLLIIDHGQQYYSLMSRAASFLKEKDSLVLAGEVIGIMGEKSQLPADGLHFEIRRGSDPEDPLPWLDTTQLRLASGQGRKTRPTTSAPP